MTALLVTTTAIAPGVQAIVGYMGDVASKRIRHTSGAPFDPHDPAFLADPYPVFAAMRECAEVHPHSILGMPVAVSHAACSTILRHRSLGRVWMEFQPTAACHALNLLHHNSLLENEPPTHTRLRRLIAGAFSHGHVQRMRLWVQHLADSVVAELVAAIAADGAADLLEYVAVPVPIEVIGELLGVPPADRPRLRPWSNAIVKMYEHELPETRRRAAEAAAAEFSAYLRALAEERRRYPTDDLITDLVRQTDADGARLSADELVGTAALLLMAGHEASVNVIGNGVWGLLKNQDQWQLLVREPELAERAVEEMIRYDSPLQLFERTATADVEIAGYRLRRGEKIAALIGAAAHDPAVFCDPSTMDITRDPNPHLGFGAGIHYCLGAPLARIEASAILRALIAALPDLVPVAEPKRRDQFVIRGLRTLPVSTARLI